MGVIPSLRRIGDQAFGDQRAGIVESLNDLPYRRDLTEFLAIKLLVGADVALEPGDIHPFLNKEDDGQLLAVSNSDLVTNGHRHREPAGDQLVAASAYRDEKIALGDLLQRDVGRRNDA